MAAFLSGLTGLITAIPILDRWMKMLVRFYFQRKLEAHDRDFIEALGDIVSSFDQRKLERVSGSDNAGLPARRREGVEIRQRRHRGEE